MLRKVPINQAIKITPATPPATLKELLRNRGSEVKYKKTNQPE